MAWQDDVNRYYGRPAPSRPALPRAPLPTTGTADALMGAITTLQKLVLDHESRLRALERTPYLPQRIGPLGVF